MTTMLLLLTTNAKQNRHNKKKRKNEKKKKYLRILIKLTLTSFFEYLLQLIHKRIKCTLNLISEDIYICVQQEE
jgi:Fe-S cluster assembly iron-binding protein IscA